MKSEATLEDTFDADKQSVVFTPKDNPYGIATVEVIQKVFVKITVKFDRDDADHQSKYFYFKVTNTMVDSGIRETSFQWNENTSTVTTVGASASLSVDGEAEATLGWSSKTNQGVDAFQHLVEARHEATKVLTFEAVDSTTYNQKFTIDAGVNWKLSIVDDTWQGAFVDTAKLTGYAQYSSVMALGKITTIVCPDGTLDKCPQTYDVKKADVGNPELTADRVNLATVTYVLKRP